MKCETYEGALQVEELIAFEDLWLLEDVRAEEEFGERLPFYTTWCDVRSYLGKLETNLHHPWFPETVS